MRTGSCHDTELTRNKEGGVGSLAPTSVGAIYLEAELKIFQKREYIKVVGLRSSLKWFSTESLILKYQVILLMEEKIEGFKVKLKIIV